MSSTPWYGQDRKRTEAHKARMRVSALARYHQLKRDGYCPGCLGEKPKDDGHVYCAVCLESKREESKDLRSFGLRP